MDFKKEQFDTKYVTTLFFQDSDNPECPKWYGVPRVLRKTIDTLLDYNIGAEIVLRLPKRDRSNDGPAERELPDAPIREGIYKVAVRTSDLFEPDEIHQECEGTLVRAYILKYDRPEKTTS